jgi:hypothetical protein
MISVADHEGIRVRDLVEVNCLNRFEKHFNRWQLRQYTSIHETSQPR